MSGPQPLRSEKYPNGLPSLTPSEQERVKKANDSYDATVKLIRMLISFNISVSIENPKNSFFWMVDSVAALLAEFRQNFFSCFHHCMHGGKRDKQTAWWSWNPPSPHENLFSSLELACDGQHAHAPWRPYRNAEGVTVFPTKEEASYPLLLCQRVACILKQEATKFGFVFPEELDEQLTSAPQAATRQLFAAQPRGHRLRPLVSEYGHYGVCGCWQN